MKLILASNSPRRTQLLTQVGLKHIVIPSDCEEIISKSLPEQVVMELAKQKAEDVFITYKMQHENETFAVIGSDTIVAQDGAILGKPKDEEDAYRMIHSLQGKTHQVYTGVAILSNQSGVRKETVFYECSQVIVYPMTEEEICNYIHTGEPMDKAGAYGIQGAFAAYVSGIKGDYNTIVGLPVARVYQELKTIMNFEKRFEFREIYQEEAGQAVEIETICFPPHEACTKEMMQERVNLAPEMFLVAVDKATGKIAGYVTGLATQEEVFRDEFFFDAKLYDPDGKNVMILGLEVLPGYRGEGLAREIMIRFLQRERKRNRESVILTCLEDKIQMYENMGFYNQGISKSSWGDEAWYDMSYIFVNGV